MTQLGSESGRIAFLVRRDGHDEACKWVERTVGIYRRALEQPDHFAADPAYRALFAKAVREFEEWLGPRPAGPRND